MSTQPVDYDALAKKYGATASAVDYDALAKQHGATSSTPAEKPADVPWYKRAANVALGPIMDTLGGGANATARELLHQASGDPFLYDSIRQSQSRGPSEADAKSPIKYAIKQGLGGATADTADTVASFTSPVSIALMGAGAATKLPGAAATVGKVALRTAAPVFAGAGAKEIVDAGTANTPEAWQQRLMGGAMAAGGAAGVADLLKASPKSLSAVKDAVIPAGKQQSVVASAMNLPMKAVQGAEGIFRAAAPTGTKQGFRENLYAASGDLAEIARHTDIAESKGGIINPDMRVRATVDAINDHLNDMYELERAPQIQRNANVPVKLPFDEDAAQGLKYLARRAGTAADRELAQTVLDSRQPNIAQIDQLAKVANQELKGFESMTPAERAAASATNMRLNSLKALDKVLGKSLDGALTSQGEGGIRAYERRFAALSEVRDQLSRRINATELERKVSFPGSEFIKGAIKGKSGIASASQAAIADVNIGKHLQEGLQKLADSGISPERPKGTGVKAPPPQAQKLLPGSTAIELGNGQPIDAPGQLMEPVRAVVRDPKTGKMKRMYLTGSN